MKSQNRHHISLNFSPEFWDNLSNIWLTPRALRELDRRNNIQSSPEPTPPGEVYSRDLARFARHGGPDLQHLRGVCLGFRDLYHQQLIYLSSARSQDATRWLLVNLLKPLTPMNIYKIFMRQAFPQKIPENHLHTIRTLNNILLTTIYISRGMNPQKAVGHQSLVI